jgi:hypothetical protein
MSNVSDDYYLIVGEELKAGFRDEGLWTKAFALEDGNEAKAKAHYIRLRVEQLSERDAAKLARTEKNPHKAKDHGVVQDTPQNFKINVSSEKIASKNLRNIIFLLIGIAFIFIAYKNISSPKPASPNQTTLTPSTPSEKSVPAAEKFNAPSASDLLQAGVMINETDTGRIISIDGEITQTMAKIVKKVLADKYYTVDLNWPIILIDSKGGDLYAAMEIGRAIRSLSMSSVVVGRDAVCFSSCVFILAAAEQRLREGKIGIHRPYAESPSISADVAAKNFQQISIDAKKYLREMRIREALFDEMANIPPDQIYIFRSLEELNRYGLIGLDPVAEERLTAIRMKQYSITDRQVYMQRNKDANATCSNDFIYAGEKYTFSRCYDAFMNNTLRISR